MIRRNFIFILLFTTIIFSCNQGPDNAGNKDSVQTESVTAPDMHTAQIALDVAGTYTGTLPCADCEGIETSISLNNDSSYTRIQKYKNKENNEFKDEGTWAFLPDGNTIALDNGKDGILKFKVGENILTQLTSKGKEISGPLAKDYILKKLLD